LKPLRLQIRGNVWRVGFRTMKAEDVGWCDYEKRQIHISPKAPMPDTLIHEVLHACLPDLDEDAILETEEAIVNALDLDL
jgi:ribulose-5-phosphate 4-epimerase/fuculose-1-phosphate aldolase